MRCTLISLTACLMAVSGCAGETAPMEPDVMMGTMTVSCPDTAPNADALQAPCCFRRSNDDRMAAPELRLTALDFDQPRTLNMVIVEGVMQSVLDAEGFNWLIQISDADGPAPAVTTGFGLRQSDGTFSFAAGEAPAPGDANRWDPITFAADITDETLSGSHDGVMLLPIQSMGEVVLELPVERFEVVRADLTESRTCVGSRRRSDFDTNAGELRAFVTVEDAAAGRIDFDPINNFLCNFIADIAENTVTCTDIPREEWSVLPDSLCDEGGCVEGACDPLDAESGCNAWLLTGTFSAAGVEIN